MNPKLNLIQQQHTMLLYPVDDEEDAIARYVNEALGRGQLTVYLPVNGDNNNNNNNNNNASHSIQDALSEGVDYKENMNRGNLLTFDTGTFYNFALAGNLQPFEELKVLIEEAIEEKRILSKNKEVNEEEVIVVVVAGVAAELNRNEKFDECINVEKWWQNTHSGMATERPKGHYNMPTFQCNVGQW